MSIDLSDFCTTGWAVISDDSGLATRAIEVASHFYSLGVSARLDCHISRTETGARGFTMGEAEISQRQEIATIQDIAWAPGQSARGYSSFDVGRFVPDAIDPLSQFLYAPNLYPTTECEQEVTALHHEFEALAQRVSEAISRQTSVALPPSENAYSAMRLLYYPAGARGWSKAHTDFELFAIIASSANGLEIEDSDGWLPLETGDDSLVLLAGDCLSSLSGGLIPAVNHRVALGLERYSIPYFQGLTLDRVLPEVGMTFGEHVAGRLVQSFPHLRLAHEAGTLLPDLSIPQKNPFHA